MQQRRWKWERHVETRGNTQNSPSLDSWWQEEKWLTKRNMVKISERHLKDQKLSKSNIAKLAAKRQKWRSPEDALCTTYIQRGLGTHTAFCGWVPGMHRKNKNLMRAGGKVKSFLEVIRWLGRSVRDLTFLEASFIEGGVYLLSLVALPSSSPRKGGTKLGPVIMLDSGSTHTIVYFVTWDFPELWELPKWAKYFYVKS